MSKARQRHGAATDSILLTLTKIATVFVSFAIGKIFAVFYSLEEYGTYSQAMLIATSITSIAILGLADATNFFYNTSPTTEKSAYISTIFGIQLFAGTIFGLIVLASNGILTKIFDNNALTRLIPLVAFLPLANNLLAIIQILFVSVRETRTIVIRNIVISLMKLVVVVVAGITNRSLQFVVAIQLIIDICQICLLFGLLRKRHLAIGFRFFRSSLVKEILRFGLPMMVFIATNALSRDLDKYVVGFFSDAKTVAVYTNASKMLPFDLISASFMTVLIPIITRLLKERSYEKLLDVFKEYLRIGYLTTWILVSCVLLCAEETMILLYDEKYLSGVGIFIVYLFTDALRFANTSVILSACGKTQTLMGLSLLSLAINFILNIAFYRLWGWLGPAIATLVVTLGYNILILRMSARVLNIAFEKLFNWQEVGSLLLIIGVCFGGAYGIKLIVSNFCHNYVVVLIVTGGLHLCATAYLFKNKIIDCIKKINSYK